MTRRMLAAALAAFVAATALAPAPAAAYDALAALQGRLNSIQRQQARERAMGYYRPDRLQTDPGYRAHAYGMLGRAQQTTRPMIYGGQPTIPQSQYNRMRDMTGYYAPPSRGQYVPPEYWSSRYRNYTRR